MDIMLKIRQAAYTEEIDYLFLLNCLSSYKQPRDKITDLLKKEALIRVKKGLYVFGKNYQKRPYSLEVLANLIYGPSYVSFEYALSFYGLIPEAVKLVTSASFKRNKHFDTPVSSFAYQLIPKKVYPIGMKRVSLDEYTHFFMASKEKALADFLAREKPFSSEKELMNYLKEGMRIEEEEFLNLDGSMLGEIAEGYQKTNVHLFYRAIKS